MPTVRYTVMDGEMVAEKRDGVRRCYVPDAIGSTVALLDNAQAQTDTFNYWPYGEEKSRTGSTPTPFRYVGAEGYYTESDGRLYVRARQLSPARGRWLTSDPLTFGGGDGDFYRYCANRPVSFGDPSGLTVPAAASGGGIGAVIIGAFIGLHCILCLNSAAELALRWIRPLPPRMRPDDVNAIRHCYWMCLAVRMCGANCARLADLRELRLDPDSRVDLCNNRISRAISSRSGGCKALCDAAFWDNELITSKLDLRCPIPKRVSPSDRDCLLAPDPNFPTWPGAGT